MIFTRKDKYIIVVTPPRTQRTARTEVMKLILNDIREIKKSIIELQMKIDSFTTTGAIRYDRECVQTSSSCDSLEKSVLRLIEDKDNLQKMIKEYQYMCSQINFALYPIRQREFIKLYYFQAYSMKKCCHEMNTTYNNLCNIKKRIEC